MYWSCLVSLIIFLSSVILEFLNKLPTLENFFSTSSISLFVAKLSIFGILSLNSVSFDLQSAFVTKL